MVDNLEKVLQFPDLFEYNEGSSPLLYCGEEPFDKIGNNGEFRDRNTGLTLKPKGGKTRATLENSSGGRQHVGSTFHKGTSKITNNPNDVTAVVLIYVASPGKTGPSPDTSGNVATLADIINQATPPTDPNKKPGGGRAGIYEGKTMDLITGYWFTAFPILHEFVHVAQPDRSKFSRAKWQRQLIANNGTLLSYLGKRRNIWVESLHGQFCKWC